MVDGYAVKVLLMSPILIDYAGQLRARGPAGPVVLRDLPTARTLWLAQWRFALLVAVVSPVAYIAGAVCHAAGTLSHVAPAREVSMLFAALIGGHLLGEGDRLARVRCGHCSGCARPGFGMTSRRWPSSAADGDEQGAAGVFRRCF